MTEKDEHGQTHEFVVGMAHKVPTNTGLRAMSVINGGQ